MSGQLVPIAAILASVGLVGLVGLVRLDKRGAALVIAVAVFLLFTANLAEAGREVGQDQNRVAVAVGLHAQGRDAEALVEVRQALKLDSARSVLSLEAALLSNLGDFAKARYYYEGALKIRPKFTLAMFGLGLCDYHEGRVAEARARWQEVLRLDPSFTRAGQALEQRK